MLKRLGKLLDLDKTELSVVFVNDRKIRELNKTYRSVDRTTDVLSFPLHDSMKETPPAHTPKDVLLGDIVINLHKTVQQAKEHGNTFHEELTFLLIHGLLHLIGYDHEINSHQARNMRKKELELLRALKEMGSVRK